MSSLPSDTNPSSIAAPFQTLLQAAKALVHADAAALLRLEEDTLIPIAVEGLSDDAVAFR